MEDLPSSLVAEILSRLSDSGDLCRCRAVSKSLLAASRQIRSLSHLCTAGSYLASRGGGGGDSAAWTALPFKPALAALAKASTGLESLSVAVDKSLGRLSYDDAEDDGDDLYLSDAAFLSGWIPSVAAGLRSLSISDFWSQSSWRKSRALALISSHCCDLLELELKNTWLSVDGLKPMPKLTILTLEYIRLDDEDLNRVSDCFPTLEVLNLIGVGGLKDPKINLSRLKSCRWTISNAPNSLSVLAPNLVELKLECVRPRSLVLETPSLVDLHLTIDKANEVKSEASEGFMFLKSLELVSPNLHSLVGMFCSSKSVESLAVDVPGQYKSAAPKLSLGVFNSFPNLSSLKVGPGAWSEMEALFCNEGSEESGDGLAAINGLKNITAHLVVNEINTTLSYISHILVRHVNILEIGLLVHSEVAPSIASKLLSKCRASWPRLRWRWGFWKEGTDDFWVLDET